MIARRDSMLQAHTVIVERGVAVISVVGDAGIRAARRRVVRAEAQRDPVVCGRTTPPTMNSFGCSPTSSHAPRDRRRRHDGGAVERGVAALR
jgi:hypothetical protein